MAGACTWVPAWKDATPNVPKNMQNGTEYTAYWILPAVGQNSEDGGRDARTSTAGLQARRRLHILTVATPQACAMLHCWTGWMRDMQLQDDDVEYLTHVYTFTPKHGSGSGTRSGNSNFGSPSFNQAAAAKSELVDEFLSTMREGALVLFTDLDVIPLRSYGVLVDYLETEAPSFEILFMWDMLRHIPANVGFMIMRNTAAVRHLIREWRVRQQHNTAQSTSDQMLLNRMLLHEHTSNSHFHYCPNCNRSIRWGNIPQTIVSQLDNFNRSSVIAFHATGASSHHTKMDRITRAIDWVLNGSDAPSKPWLPRHCDESHNGCTRP